MLKKFSRFLERTIGWFAANYFATWFLSLSNREIFRWYPGQHSWYSLRRLNNFVFSFVNVCTVVMFTIVSSQLVVLFVHASEIHLWFGIFSFLFFLNIAVLNYFVQKQPEEEAFGIANTESSVYRAYRSCRLGLRPLTTSLFCLFGLIFGFSVLLKGLSAYSPSWFSSYASGSHWEWVFFSASYLEIFKISSVPIENIPKSNSPLILFLSKFFSISVGYYNISLLKDFFHRRSIFEKILINFEMAHQSEKQEEKEKIRQSLIFIGGLFLHRLRNVMEHCSDEKLKKEFEKIISAIRQTNEHQVNFYLGTLRKLSEKKSAKKDFKLIEELEKRVSREEILDSLKTNKEDKKLPSDFYVRFLFKYKDTSFRKWAEETNAALTSIHGLVDKMKPDLADKFFSYFISLIEGWGHNDKDRISKPFEKALKSYLSKYSDSNKYLKSDFLSLDEYEKMKEFLDDFFEKYESEKK